MEPRNDVRARLRAVRHCALGGGGAQGVLYAGMLNALFEDHGVDWGAGVPHRLEGVAGTSVGALFALLITLRYTAVEIAAEIDALPCLAAPRLGSVTRHMAADDGAHLRALLERLLYRKLGVRDMTLRALHAACGTDLVVVATDLTTLGVRYLRASTDGDLSVIKAVLASMAVPGVFPPQIVRDHTLVDGCMQDGYAAMVWPPEHLFGACFMFNIDARAPPTRPAGYLRRIMIMMQLSHEVASWAALPDAYKARTLLLDSAGQQGVPSASMALSPEERRALMTRGAATTRAGLRHWGERGPAYPHREGDVAHCLPPPVRAARVQPQWYDLLASRQAVPQESERVTAHALGVLVLTLLVTAAMRVLL